MELFDSATSIARRVRADELDPVDVVDAYIDRIEGTGDRTNAYVTVLDEKAREAARGVRERVEAGDDLPLAGVPVAVKDLSETKEGVRNTKGLAPFADNVADETTVTVRRLEEAGAVVVGTTNTPELGHTVRTDNELQGPTSTPFDLDRNAGGSSGGSAAALADGLCALATGSDVGGSLRNPASCCGVVSVKPSHGVVPRGSRVNGFRGHTPVGVLGPMGRTVEDVAAMLDVLAGKDPVDPFSVPKTASYKDAVADPPETADLSLAYSPDLDLFSVAPEVRDAIEGT
ncbi:MAG: amidase, partial [Halobacteriales archaeon]